MVKRESPDDSAKASWKVVELRTTPKCEIPYQVPQRECWWPVSAASCVRALIANGCRGPHFSADAGAIPLYEFGSFFRYSYCD